MAQMKELVYKIRVDTTDLVDKLSLSRIRPGEWIVIALLVVMLICNVILVATAL